MTYVFHWNLREWGGLVVPGDLRKRWLRRTKRRQRKTNPLLPEFSSSLVTSGLLVTALLAGVRWRLTLVLSCVSLRVRDD